MEQSYNINTSFSEDCFRLIFDCIPHQQKLSLRLVCTKWNSLICSIFTSVHSLKIFGCEEDLGHLVKGIKIYRVKDTLEVQEMIGTEFQKCLNDFHYDALMVKKDASTARLACTMLPKLFPNVQYLALACKQLYGSDHLPETLSSWSHSLESILILKMPANPPTNFWPALSTCSKLTRLHFIHAYNNSMPTSLLSSFSNLKHFFLTHYLYDTVDILGSLRAVENIKMAMVILNVEMLQKIIELNPKIVTKLKCLSLGTISPPSCIDRYVNLKQVLHFFCTHFKNIFYIDVLFADHLPLHELIPILSQLSTLTELWMYVGRHMLPTNSKVQINSLPRLTSVTSLYIEVYDIKPEQFAKMLSYLFPNLKSLTLKVEADISEKELFQEKVSNEFTNIKDKFKIVES